MKHAMDPHNLLSPGSLVESSPICRTSTPPRPRDRAEAIVLADAFFVVSSLPPPTSPAGLPLPCLPLHQAPRTIRKCQFFIAAAEQRRWSRRVLWHCVRKRWGGGVGALYQAVVVVEVGALYQARTRSRLLPTHRPWRLTIPPSPFFAGCAGSY